MRCGCAAGCTRDGRAPRQRLFRQRGQPRRAHHGRGARRPGDPFAGRRRAHRQAGCRTGVTLRDLGSVRLRDLARPERVYQVVHPQLRQDFPALRSLEATPNNLPQQMSSFVGREERAGRGQEGVRRRRGLLTLLGVGGLGKTRLSLQIGRRRDGRLSGRRLVRGAGAAAGSPAGARRPSPRRSASSKSPGARCRRRWSSTSTTGSCSSFSTIASTWRGRAPSWRKRCSRRVRRSRCWRRAASRCTFRARRRSRCRRSPFRRRTAR